MHWVLNTSFEVDGRGIEGISFHLAVIVYFRWKGRCFLGLIVSYWVIFLEIGVLQNLLFFTTSCVSFSLVFRFLDSSIIGSIGVIRGGETSTEDTLFRQFYILKKCRRKTYPWPRSVQLWFFVFLASQLIWKGQVGWDISKCPWAKQPDSLKSQL